MRILAIDYGIKRVGLAISDSSQKIAFPLVAIELVNKNDFHAIWNQLQKIICNYHEEVTLLLGNPVSTNQQSSKIQQIIFQFFRFIQNKKQWPIFLYNEQFTSKIADNILTGFGIRSKDRRILNDSAAAVVMLQEYLDFNKPNLS